jgi:hypothetical protein
MILNDGTEMPTTYLPREHHIARYIRARMLMREIVDGTQRIIGVHPSAFALRDVEKNLSVDWMEHYEGSKLEKLRRIVNHAELELKPRDAYGVLQVGGVSDACAERGARVRIIYDPTVGNPAHSSIHQYPRDNTELFAVLAEMASSDVTSVIDIRNSDVSD